jgi:hypothetical protein
MVKRILSWAICAAVVLAIGRLAPVKAQSSDSERTFLTFSHPVRLPGVALGSGTYIFEIAEPSSSAVSDVVRVLSRDRRISYYMGFTRRIERPDRQSLDVGVSLGEAASGEAPEVKVWWPAGETTGHEFIYPVR